MRIRLFLLAALVAVPLVAAEAPQDAARVEVSATGEAPPAPGRLPDLEVAYHAFASGDLENAERMLTQLIRHQPSPAAFLLRGCTRFTAAMLAKDPGGLSEGARADIRRAFEMNPSIWLDPKRFSPRLIAFLDTVRQ